MVVVLTVRYFAAARAAAGVSEETLPAGTLHDLREAMVDAHGERLAAVLKVASYLVDGQSWRDLHAPLPVGATVDVLPPFAGG
jgi:molybdopterin converting factor small subunit